MRSPGDPSTSGGGGGGAPTPRPPLPPHLTLLTTAGSHPREVPSAHSSARELVSSHSAASSLGTCSSMEDDGGLPLPGAAAATPGAGAGGSAAPTPPHSGGEPRSVSFAAGSFRRGGSLLSDSGRASRRDSHGTDGAGDRSPASGAQATPPGAAGDEGTPAWWAPPWTFGTHSVQNGRRHMEDRLAACDVSREPAFAGFKRAGFFAVFDG